MKITEIELPNKLIFKFKFRDKPYRMIMEIVAKSNKYIVIPSILANNQVLDPGMITDVEFIYTVKDGIFLYNNTKLETSSFQGMRVYQVSTEDDITRLNRRGAYRVFIGELIKMLVVNPNGKKKEMDGILKDLSVTGMGIISKVELEIGSNISMIYNYEGLNVHLTGQIIRKDKLERYRAYNYGCIFKEPNNGVNKVVTLKQFKN